tara:strand:+ start:2252 stop:2497 length:246 start_codon:yes stop_codon:yes gene_type:complete
VFCSVFPVSVPLAQAAETSPRGFRELQRYAAGEAHQAVAVDEASLYAIASREIAGYQKSDGTPQSRTRQALKHQVTGFFKS